MTGTQIPPASNGAVPYSPEWLNALSDAEKQSVAMSDFSRSMHNSGGPACLRQRIVLTKAEKQRIRARVFFDDQLDLLAGKRANLFAVDRNGSDQRIVFQHWHPDGGSRPTEPRRRGWNRISGIISGVDHLLRTQHAIHSATQYRLKWPAPLLEIGECGRRADSRREMEGVAVETKYVPEIRLAEASGILKDGLKYRLQVAR